MIERYLSIARVAQLTVKNCIDYLQRALKPIYRLRTNPLALVYSLILLSSLWVFFCDLMQFWHVDKVCLHVHTYISIYLSVCLIHTCVRAHTHAHTYAPCPPTHTLGAQRSVFLFRKGWCHPYQGRIRDTFLFPPTGTPVPWQLAKKDYALQIVLFN